MTLANRVKAQLHTYSMLYGRPRLTNTSPEPSLRTVSTLPNPVELSFNTAEEVIAQLGQPVTAQRKTAVRIRPAVGVEVFHHPHGDLTAVEGQDWVVMPVDGGQPYPCKIDIFEETWVPETYKRKALSRLIQVPEGVTVTLNTLEGTTRVSHPDYIALGERGEVYSNRADWVANNLEFIDP